MPCAGQQTIRTARYPIFLCTDLCTDRAWLTVDFSGCRWTRYRVKLLLNQDVADFSRSLWNIHWSG